MSNKQESTSAGESVLPTMTPLSLWLMPRAAFMAKASVLGFFAFLVMVVIRLVRNPRDWLASLVGDAAAYWAFTSWTQIGKYLGVLPSRHGLPFWPLGARMMFRSGIVWTAVACACFLLGFQEGNWKLVLATYLVGSAIGKLTIDLPDARHFPMESTSIHVGTAIRNVVLAAIVLYWWWALR